MKIATLLFTYARSEHTEKVLAALKKNRELPQMLYIFQDGKKDTTNHEEWQKVNLLIKSVDWCNSKVITADDNKGLAKSIVDGVNKVFECYDAVIVLEDDCVPHPLFLTYMHNALRHYEKMEKVYTICGYSYPVEVEQNGTDTYFTQRASSWGWATWKSKWLVYKEDYKILGRIMKNPYLSEKMHFWGEDLESYLLGNVYGTCNSWAVFWALNVLEQDGYCVFPYKSLIENIGFDGSGVHCGKKKNDEIEMYAEDFEKEFVFCDEIYISERTKRNYSNYWTWKSVETRNSCYYYLLLRWMELHRQKKTINEYFDMCNVKNICVWGKGKICDLLLNEIDENRNVLAIIESKLSGEYYQGIPMVEAKDIPKNTDMIIIIPEYDYEKIIWKIEEDLHDKVKKISELM